MPVSEIHHIPMIVSDIERSAAFYEQGLGWRRTLSSTASGPDFEKSLGLPPGTSARVQYLQGPSQIGQIELIQWDQPHEGQQRRSPFQLGPLLLSFQVPQDEIQELYERFLAMGAECIAEPLRMRLENYGYLTAFAIRDPDGIMSEFVALPTREQILAFREGNEEA
jgi:catechol 2,3-dioxygenase-like lactoylglutathione lyase family enzyme